MLIHRGIVVLDYDPATDILATSMPDVRQSELPQVSYCLRLIVETINSYYVKNLLMDCSKCAIEVDEETYNAIARQFSTNLMKTRLRKLAWVVSAGAKIYTEIRQELNLEIELRGFNSKPEAMEWLLKLEPA